MGNNNLHFFNLLVFDLKTQGFEAFITKCPGLEWELVWQSLQLGELCHMAEHMQQEHAAFRQEVGPFTQHYQNQKNNLLLSHVRFHFHG
ncbi:hypothetical protein QVD17_03282 [Tagetes erecta]|uniref:Uncharacterized protein n=1 Tax=Tagetes erecta TaxID=13708 RepID=A0AAD8P9V5_TARER|nr:hypothetical protein QVD17_03282 [Tagetes erecta]